MVFPWMKYLETIQLPYLILLDTVSRQYQSDGTRGIDNITTVPTGGIIHTDESGQPTGFLQEGAIELISPLMVSQFTDEQISASNLENQIAIFHAAGITSVSEILAVPGVRLSFPELYHAIEDLQFRVAYYTHLHNRRLTTNGTVCWRRIPMGTL